jgi:hypothetical protein
VTGELRITIHAARGLKGQWFWRCAVSGGRSNCVEHGLLRLSIGFVNVALLTTPPILPMRYSAERLVVSESEPAFTLTNTRANCLWRVGCCGNSSEDGPQLHEKDGRSVRADRTLRWTIPPSCAPHHCRPHRFATPKKLIRFPRIPVRLNSLPPSTDMLTLCLWWESWCGHFLVFRFFFSCFFIVKLRSTLSAQQLLSKF